MKTENPKVRPLDAFPVQVSGKEMIGIKDPAGINPEIIFVPPEAFFLVSLMDGTHSLRDLQAAYMRKYGELLFSDKIEKLIEQLDSQYLLETTRFEDHLCHLREEFKGATVRKATFAGRGYEGDPQRLRAQLRGYFTEKEGPGLSEERGQQRRVKGIVAPHIDFARGGACYAYAYKTLGESIGEDLYVILGTCHAPMQNPFAFTLKAFETPLGRVEVDAHIVQEVAQRLPFDPFLDEFCHRHEHTIEFQVLFLQYLLGEKKFKIFPILCGSFQEKIKQRISPREDPGYRESISILTEQFPRLPHLCLVASADLAHVGPQFGGAQPVTPGVLAEIKTKDLEMLQYVAQLNGEEFYQYVLREEDKRNICGLPPIYALVNLIQAQKGELLKYQQWYDPQGRGTVTFASMVFS
ncbi:MAG: AmmeMemoRadiSam system protein B [Deltaproteobacteria bacterium]|nr:MAG: AmmeMemoRadiSam system protein B [Deltaproteobacteria bacterium]